jgi:hypothetical protein
MNSAVQPLRFEVEVDPRKAPRDVSEEDMRDVQQMLPDLIASVLNLRHARRAQAREALVELFAGQAQLRPIDTVLAKMEARAIDAVRGGTTWYTAREIADRAALGRVNPIATVARWKNQGRIFALREKGVDRYPAYALGRDFNPLPAMRDVLAALGDHDAEYLAGWFESTSKFLGGKRPREILSDDPVRVVSAAKYNTESRKCAG